MTARGLAPLAGLLALAAVLALVFWPRDTEQPDGSTSGSSPSYTVTLTAPVGEPAEVTVRRHDGGAPPFDAVTLEPAMPQMGHALPAMRAERVGGGRDGAGPAGRFATRGPLLTMPGPWEVLVLLGEGPGAEFVIVHTE